MVPSLLIITGPNSANEIVSPSFRVRIGASEDEDVLSSGNARVSLLSFSEPIILDGNEASFCSGIGLLWKPSVSAA